MPHQSLYEQVIDYANRANPYSLYAQLLQTPVTRQVDGSYIVSTYREIISLLHDPRISSDFRNRSVQEHAQASLPNNQEIVSVKQVQDAGTKTARPNQSSEEEIALSFIGLDPPEHDRLRRQATRPFGALHIHLERWLLWNPR